MPSEWPLGRFPAGDVVPDPKWQYTHAVTINVSAAEVWPWVVQMGQGRGGFYSYELLENLAWCNIHNADSIIPEFQKLEVGDKIWLHPRAPPLPVTGIEPSRFLLLGTAPNCNDSEGDYAGALWLLFLDEVSEATTRLISHGRNDCSPGLRQAIKLSFAQTVMEPIAFVMGRKILLGIKRRAEALSKRDRTHL